MITKATKGTITVVIIDDSAFMRKALTMMLESDPQIKVVATAGDGREGIEKILQYKPSLVTLDLEMPGMDGLTALGIIMRDMPLPVLVVSSLTREGSQVTLDALNLGAVDFIPKELSYVSLDIVKIKDELVSKVRHIVENQSFSMKIQRNGIPRFPLQSKKPRASPGLPRNRKSQETDYRVVTIGISTGGPFALLHTIPTLPADFPLGIAIVQHMPPHFTRTLAERLDSVSRLHVKEAEDGEKIDAGIVLIAPGGNHLTFRRDAAGVRTIVSVEPLNSMYRPSADLLMESAAQSFEGPIIGVIMTGMGKDGLEGLRVIKKRGGYVIAQDEASSVVYGMPKAAVNDGIADEVIPLEEIPAALVQLVS